MAKVLISLNKGTDLKIEVSISLNEAIHGCTKGIVIKRQVKCITCNSKL